MDLNMNDLRTACFEAAKNAKWQLTPQPAEDIQKLSDKIYKIALDQKELMCEIDADPEIVTRAIWYITEVHVNPSIGDDVSWFLTTLQTLLEVAVPNGQVPPGKARAFIQDLLKGIASSINDPIGPEE